jgi:methionyl-tRNA synthetase
MSGAEEELAKILHPFLPFSSEEIKRILSIDEWKWETISISTFRKINKVTHLFERIDIKRIDEERAKLDQGV